jgi:hypothetical protein
MTRDRIRVLIDHNELRDKVAADDPAIVPMDTDAEAAGTPTPPEADALDYAQAASAKRRVPHPDPSRVRANPKEPWRR